tara:strand:+ start:353 stop:844 length:492 start_codon:yes stop_codon:yes gene_type:complete
MKIFSVLALLLLIPSLSSAKLTFSEEPSSKNELDLIKANSSNWGFETWDEMKKNVNVTVEQYRAYIGARCGGFFYVSLEKDKFNNSNIFSKIETMNELLEKYSLDVYTEAVSEDALIWSYFQKHMYKEFYFELYDFSQKHNLNMNTIIKDREICEGYYEKFLS